VQEDKRYPVEQIIRMATGATDFSAGEEANNYVTKRGLVVVPLENTSADKDSLGLRDRLEEILAKYASARASEPFGGHELRSTFKGVSDAITATRAVSERPSLQVTWSVGQGNWVTIPWIALLDARETDTTQRGAYGVYLFCEDMSGVYLAFAQGVTEPRDWYRSTVRAREHLRAQAKGIRRYCEDLAQQGFALDDDIDLHTDAGLGIDYEASTIAHKFYAAGSVPDDQKLISELQTVLSAYDRYLEDPKSRRCRLWRGAHREQRGARQLRQCGTWRCEPTRCAERAGAQQRVRCDDHRRRCVPAQLRGRGDTCNGQRSVGQARPIERGHRRQRPKRRGHKGLRVARGNRLLLRGGAAPSTH
jgi:hypothetical protein